MVERESTVEDVVAGAEFWRGRRVFLTGHTGFKGGWMALWLARRGALVRGYALYPVTEPNLFTVAKVGSVVEDVRGDIRDAAKLDAAMQAFAPQVVFHMAAQPLVRYSYVDPIGTYETNVMGTARVLEAVRKTASVRAVVSVTTDKCYDNRETLHAYSEGDPLGGYDPYSSSKACAEIVTAAYRQSFLAERGVAAATARAGNVIGGGDWSDDRLIPDLVRGFLTGEAVKLRNPHAIRPWQHVLEPVMGYLLLAEKLLSGDARYARAYNFGPSEEDARDVAWIAERMAALWGNGAQWAIDAEPGVHEAAYLKLDASRARAELGWRPKLELPVAMDWLVQWYKTWQSGAEMHAATLEQIARFEALS